MEWKHLVASVLHGHFFPSPFLSANIFSILFYSLAVRFVCKFSQVCPLYWFGQKTSVKGPNTNCQESHRKKRDSSVGNSRCHGAAFTQMKYRTHRVPKYLRRELCQNNVSLTLFSLLMWLRHCTLGPMLQEKTSKINVCQYLQQT